MAKELETFSGKIITEQGVPDELRSKENSPGTNGVNVGKSLDYISIAQGLKRKVFYIDRNLQIDSEEGAAYIDELVSRHRQMIAYYDRLEDMYLGSTQILKMKAKDDGKSDERISTNFAKYIVDTETGFFNGNDAQFQHDDKNINEAVSLWLRLNDAGSTFNHLAKLCSMYGHSYVFLFDDPLAQVIYKQQIDEIEVNNSHSIFSKFKDAITGESKKKAIAANLPLNKLKMTTVEPQEAFLIYANDTTKEPLYAFVYTNFNDDTGEITGKLYKSSEEIGYLFSKKKDSDESNSVKIIRSDLESEELFINKFDGLPLIEVKQNEERVGKVELVYTAQNVYNKVISDSANDVSYLADNILHIDGVKLEPEQKEDMKDNKLLNTYKQTSNGIEDTKVTAQMVSKNSASEAGEKLLDRLKEDMFTVAAVINFKDIKVGQNVSGETLKVMMKDMQANALTKQRQFEKAFDGIFSILFSTWEMPLQWLNLKYMFNFDMPINKKEMAEFMKLLQGNLSTKTILENVAPLFSGSVDDELERMEQEGLLIGGDRTSSVEELLDSHRHKSDVIENGQE
ncbi:phage portal protein [Vagococcus sp. DIV0080]|uniref:Phage portal protein n=1 Tax=Candidatus Vagococcus giribetii TaxID=2230876 RepID=A0ABS3HW09_9ENTE|nr:phage portal protein [Vagococcus sp. DIV0080]